MRRTKKAKSARGNGGFTLVELMMVVAVVSIIVTVAIPGITSARRRANEASAITTLRALSSVQSQYRTRFGSFGSVTSLQSSGFIDENFSDAEKSGYSFANAVAPTEGDWAIRANPTDPGQSGNRYFFIDTSGVIRFNDSSAASASDPAIDT